MLEICGLCAGYTGKPVLHEIDLSVPTGTVTVLLGPNGCGKSTLLKALCGILPVREGTVRLDGEGLLSLPPQQLAQKISYLAQGRQVPDITVRRLVLHGRFPYLHYPRRYREQDHLAAEAAMERLQISELADTLLPNLSGGQRQKAYIAMALAQDTPVILLDEPTTYLDVTHQLQMVRLVESLREQGKTVVMVLHDLSLAMGVADQIVVMADGAVEAVGKPEQLFADGCLERVFGISVGRVQTESGWQYYYSVS